MARSRRWPSLAERRWSDQEAQRRGLARYGRRGVPDGREVGSGQELRRRAEVHRLHNRRTECEDRERSKDRELMKNVPHLLVVGMVLAGLVTGANHGYIYIRHEYHDQIHTMEPRDREGPQAWDRRRERGRLRQEVRARSLRLARRLHPGRRERAAGGHRRQARPAARQAAVPGLRRPVGQAHGDQQRRDAFVHAGHPDERPRCLEGAGQADDDE